MYRSKNQLGSRAQTLGVIVDWVGDSYQLAVLQGVAAGAAHCGANLLYFVGGTLPAKGGEAASARHRVYELAGSHNVDGLLVMSGTLIHDVGLEGLRQFAGRYMGLPLCSLGVELSGATSVTVDNADGIRSVVHHLIDTHGARRIAFVSGPAANAESRTRRDAYVAALLERGIQPDDALMVTGDFMAKGGRAAVQMLAKHAGIDTLHAIVAANDNMAAGILDELERMKVSVPAKLAVTGFDDVEDARLTQPSLTTVRQPLARQGQEAVRLLSQAIASRAVLPGVQTKTELVLRASCGCGRGRSAPSLAPQATSRRFMLEIMGRRPRIAAKLGRVARGALSGASAGWEDQLIGAIIEDIQSRAAPKFPDTFRKHCDRWMASGSDLAVIEGVVAALRRELVPLLCGEPEKKDFAEELFHDARSTISEHASRHLARTQRELTGWSRTVAYACSSISTSFNFALLRRRIKEHVPQLGVRSCFVALYEQVNEVNKARLFAGYDLGGPDPGCEGANFHAPRLLPPDLVETKGPGRSYAVLPLLCEQGILGHVMFEYHERSAFACVVAAEAISVAVRGAQLSGDRW